jgi:hypothetical protein
MELTSVAALVSKIDTANWSDGLSGRGSRRIKRASIL